MKLIPNIGNERVIDEVRSALTTGARLDLATSAMSLFAFAEMRELLERLERLESCRIVLPNSEGGDLALLGTESDRAFRNRLLAPWLARACSEWLSRSAQVREVPAALPQCMMLAGRSAGAPERIIAGDCPFTTEGLGITAGNQFSLVQASDQPAECSMFASWFAGLWNTAGNVEGGKQRLLDRLKLISDPKAPSHAYYAILESPRRKYRGQARVPPPKRGCNGGRRTWPSASVAWAPRKLHRRPPWFSRKTTWSCRTS